MQTEIEILYQYIQKLTREKLIKLHPNLRDILKAGGLKNLSLRSKHNNVLTNLNQLQKSYATTPISSADALRKSVIILF